MISGEYKMNEYAQKIRRELHRNPEIGFDLPKTLATLRRELDKIGVEYTEKFGKSGIVATINPEKSHFTIGIRADMDALPILEKNDVPYKSQCDGKMHACGHDAHTAIALATLKELNEMRDEISCRVKFIFQPAEEYAPSGAKLMAEDGVMEDIDVIVALHVEPSLDAGTVGVISGYRNATSDGFTLTFRGKSAHVAEQQHGTDAIMMAVRAYTDLEFVIAKEISAREPIIFNVGSIHGGVANNVICDECSMFCTLRTHTDETAEYVLNKVKKICEAIAETAGGSFEYEHKKHYPVVYNDPAVTELIRAAAAAVVGEENIIESRRGMGGEDFSYFANEKPGTMFHLGIRSEERGIVHKLHTDLFDLEEEALDVGVKIFKKFVLDNMK